MASTVALYQITGQDYTVPFEYLARKFVTVSLLRTGKSTTLTLGVDFRFTSKGTLTIDSDLTGWKYVEIRRVTSASERIVDFKDGSTLRASELNVSQIQALHVAEEGRDQSFDQTKALVDEAIALRDETKDYHDETKDWRDYVEQALNNAGDKGTIVRLGLGDGSTLVGYQFNESTVNRSVHSALVDTGLSITDFVGADKTGLTNSAHAFQSAYNLAKLTGCKKINVPVGKWLIEEQTIRMDMRFGAAFIGEDYLGTEIVWKTATPEKPCFHIAGDSGVNTNRTISNMTISGHNRGLIGIGIELEGCCFAILDKLFVNYLNEAIRLHNSDVGEFTEFNKVTNSRLHFCNKAISFITTGKGHNSFHGNEFHSSQLQVSRNGGIGIATEGRGRVAYLYNCRFNVGIFGGPGCIAISMVNTNSNNLVGDILCEGDLILKSDDKSIWQSHGNLLSIGAIIKDIPSEESVRQGRFTFKNTFSNRAPFNSASMPSNSTPRQFDPTLSDRTNNGVFPAIFGVSAPNIEGLGLATQSGAGNVFTFGAVPVGGNLQRFIPGLSISSDGSSIKSYSSTLFLDNTSVGIQLAAGLLAPKVDTAVSLGSGSYRWKAVYSVNGTIQTSDARNKDNVRDPSDAEHKAALAIAGLPIIWEWKKDFSPDDDTWTHISPTVQAVIKCFEDEGLDWRKYYVVQHDAISDLYSLCKEELCILCNRALARELSELKELLANK